MGYQLGSPAGKSSKKKKLPENFFKDRLARDPPFGGGGEGPRPYTNRQSASINTPPRDFGRSNPSPPCEGDALSTGFFSPALINSTSRQSDCSSRISTLNDSGTPGSMPASPLTTAS